MVILIFILLFERIQQIRRFIIDQSSKYFKVDRFTCQPFKLKKTIFQNKFHGVRYCMYASFNSCMFWLKSAAFSSNLGYSGNHYESFFFKLQFSSKKFSAVIYPCWQFSVFYKTAILKIRDVKCNGYMSKMERYYKKQYICEC